MSVGCKFWPTGCFCFHGEQLAIDKTLVSGLRRDPRGRSSSFPRALWPTRSHASGRPRSGSGRQIVSRDRAVLVTVGQGKSPSRVSVQCAWTRRWRSILACAVAQIFAVSLLGRRGCLGSYGPTPFTSERWWTTVVTSGLQ